MPTETADDPPLLLFMASVAVLVIGVAVGVTVVGDRDVPEEASPPQAREPVPEPAPVLEPAPEPEPEPTPEPVAGDVDLEVVGLAHTDARLFGGRRAESRPIPVEKDAVKAFAGRIGAWLDRHLTDLQEGGPGGVPDTEVEGPSDALSLAHEDLWVAAARYHVVVYVRGEPAWARAGVTVRREDGSTVRANLVFLPGAPPRLIAAQGPQA